MVSAASRMVVPRDARAGFPPGYVEMVFAPTPGAVETLTTAAELVEAGAS